MTTTTFTLRGPAAPSSPRVGELVWTLVRTEFKTRYHGSIGGFAWALMKPLAMFVVLLAVFSFIFVADPLYRVNLILGLFLYDFFSESTKSGLAALYSKGFLLTKAQFPRWVVVLPTAANALITLMVASVMILLFLGITGRAPGPLHVALFGGYVLAMLLMVWGISLATSVLFLKYRDLNQVWDVVVQAGFFAAPIVYPLNVIPDQYHFYLYIWPPTAIVQFSREVLVAGTIPTLKAHLLLLFMTAAIFGAGALVFRRYSRRVVEFL